MKTRFDKLCKSLTGGSALDRNGKAPAAPELPSAMSAPLEANRARGRRAPVKPPQGKGSPETPPAAESGLLRRRSPGGAGLRLGAVPANVAGHKVGSGQAQAAAPQESAVQGHELSDPHMLELAQRNPKRDHLYRSDHGDPAQGDSLRTPDARTLGFAATDTDAPPLPPGSVQTEQPGQLHSVVASETGLSREVPLSPDHSLHPGADDPPAPNLGEARFPSADYTFAHGTSITVKTRGPNITLMPWLVGMPGHLFRKFKGLAGVPDKRLLPSARGIMEPPPPPASAAMPTLTLRRKGRVNVGFVSEGLSFPEHQALSKGARVVRRLLENKSGHPCIAVEAHAASGGSLCTYGNGQMRWVGSAGPHNPISVANVYQRDAAAVDPATLVPPPLSLLTGVVPVGDPAGDGSIFRLDEQGDLYAFDKEGREWTRRANNADWIGRQQDGSAYLLKEGDLIQLDAEGGANKVCEGATLFRRLSLLDPTAAASGAVPEAIGISRNGVAYHVRDGQPGVPIEGGQGMKELVPAGDGMLCGHTVEGEFVAFHRADDGRWQRTPKSEENLFTDFSAALPSPAGRSWSVQALGYDALADGTGLALHAVLGTEHGHRVTVSWNGNEWMPQYAADCAILMSDKGMQSAAIDPGSIIEYDMDTKLAISTEGKLCMRRNDGNRWVPVPGPDGKALSGVRKLATAANGLTYAKSLYALMEREDGSTAIHSVDVTGRFKTLPADNTTQWISGASPMLLPERFGVRLGEEWVSVPPGNPNEQIADLSVDEAGNPYYLTAGGRAVFQYREKVGSQVYWPKAFKPATGPMQPRELPPAEIDGQAFDVEQLTVLGDRGRVFALARQAGDDPGPPSLLEFVHAPAGQARAGDLAPGARRMLDGHWRSLDLEVPETAQLSTSLRGTPIITVPATDTADEQRFRILQVRHRAQQGAPAEPDTYKLSDVALSNEDTRIAMKRSDGVRLKVPGARRTFLSTTVVGQTTMTKNVLPRKETSTAGKVGYYALAPFKFAGKSAANLVRLTKVPLMAPVRGGQDVFGRRDLRDDYRVVHEATRSLRERPVPQPISWQVAREASEAGWVAPQHAPDLVARSNEVVGSALEECLSRVETISVTARVLQPDLRTPRSPSRMTKARQHLAKPLNYTTINSHDVLPQIRDFFKGLNSPLARQFYTDDEKVRLAKIDQCLTLLEKNHIKLWDGQRGKLSNFTAYHGSHAGQTGGLAVAMRVLSEAVNIRVFGASPAVAAPPPLERLDELENTLQTDRCIRIAHNSVSGWAAYEATKELMKNFRGEALNRSSQLHKILSNNLGMPPFGSMSKEDYAALLATRLTEGWAEGTPRSNSSYVTKTSAGVGAIVGGGSGLLHLFSFPLAMGGVMSLSAFRTRLVGAETTPAPGEEEQGVVFVYDFLYKGVDIRAGVQGNLSLDDGKRNAGLLARGSIGGSLSRFRGGSILVAPKDFRKYWELMLSENVDPIEVLSLGVNGGGGRFSGTENVFTPLDLSARVGVYPSTPDDVLAWARDGNAKFGAYSGAGLTVGFKLFEKRIVDSRIRWPGGQHGDEGHSTYSGINAYVRLAAGCGASAVKFNTGGKNDRVETVQLATVGADGVGFSIGIDGQSTYKKTKDLKKAEHIDQDTWRSVLHNVRQVKGLHLPLPQGISVEALENLDVGTREGRAVMEAALEAWSDKIHALERAFVNDQAGLVLSAEEQVLLEEARGVDEVKACQVMLLAEHLFLTSKAAEKGMAMIVPDGYMEFNVPRAHPTKLDPSVHIKLGPAMKRAREYQQLIPQLKEFERLNGDLPGYTETRVRFQASRRVDNAANRLLVLGVPRDEWDAHGLPLPPYVDPLTDTVHLNADDVRRMAEDIPGNRVLAGMLAKNNQPDVHSKNWSIGVLASKTAVGVREKFTNEIRTDVDGWGGRSIQARLSPTAHDALTDKHQGLGAFSKIGVKTVAPPIQPLPMPVMRPLSDVFQPAGSAGVSDPGPASNAVPGPLPTPAFRTPPQQPGPSSGVGGDVPAETPSPGGQRSLAAYLDEAGLSIEPTSSAHNNCFIHAALYAVNPRLGMSEVTDRAEQVRRKAARLLKTELRNERLKPAADQTKVKNLTDAHHWLDKGLMLHRDDYATVAIQRVIEKENNVSLNMEFFDYGAGELVRSMRDPYALTLETAPRTGEGRPVTARVLQHGVNSNHYSALKEAGAV